MMKFMMIDDRFYNKSRRSISLAISHHDIFGWNVSRMVHFLDIS